MQEMKGLSSKVRPIIRGGSSDYALWMGVEEGNENKFIIIFVWLEI
jgi:hypothetical protein